MCSFFTFYMWMSEQYIKDKGQDPSVTTFYSLLLFNDLKAKCLTFLVPFMYPMHWIQLLIRHKRWTELQIYMFVNMKAVETYWVNTDFLNILLFEVHPHNRWDGSDDLQCWGDTRLSACRILPNDSQSDADPNMPPCSLCDSVPGATSNHQSHAVLFLASGQMPKPYPRIRGHYLHIIFKGLFQSLAMFEIVLKNTGVPQYQSNC